MENVRQSIIDTLVGEDGNNSFLSSLVPDNIDKTKVGDYTIVADADNLTLPIKDREQLSIAKIILSPLQPQSLKEEQDFPAIFISIDHAPRSNADVELGYTQESLNLLLEIALHDEIGPPDYKGLDSESTALATKTLPLTSQVTLIMHELDRLLMPSKLGSINHCIHDSKSGIVAFLTGPLVDTPRNRAQRGEKLTCHLRIVLSFAAVEGF